MGRAVQWDSMARWAALGVTGEDEGFVIERWFAIGVDLEGIL
jgi:hypothetical protein